MKRTNVKSSVAQFFALGLLAGAVASATPKAEAQFGIAVHIGPRPIYGGPVRPLPPPAYGYGYYGHPYYGRPYYDRPYYGWDRRERFEYRHEDRRWYR